jgi:hypothetical protein
VQTEQDWAIKLKRTEDERSRMLAVKAAAFAQAEDAHRQQLAAKNAEMQQALLDKDSELRQALAAASAREASGLHQVQEQHRSDIERLRQQHEADIERRQQQHEAEIRSLKACADLFVQAHSRSASLPTYCVSIMNTCDAKGCVWKNDENKK